MRLFYHVIYEKQEKISPRAAVFQKKGKNPKKSFPFQSDVNERIISVQMEMAV